MASAPNPPFDIGRYQCVKRLGQSEVGVSYLAQLPDHESQFVAKRIHDEILESFSIADMVLTRVTENTQLKHPQLVAPLEVIESPAGTFVISRYVEGVDLETVFQHMHYRAALPPIVVVHVISQLCEALAIAHHWSRDGQRQPMIHGGLWPSNVIIDWDGRIFVRDFGFWSPQVHELFKDGAQSAYFSPEHFAGDELDSATSDVFCVGGLLYQLLTGHGLFEGQDPLEAIGQAKRGKPLGVVDQAPLAFRALLRSCLDVDLNNRPDDARVLGARLATALPGASAPRIRRKLLVVLGEIGQREQDVTREHGARGGLSISLDDEPTSVAVIDDDIGLSDDDEPTAVGEQAEPLPLFPEDEDSVLDDDEKTEATDLSEEELDTSAGATVPGGGKKDSPADDPWADATEVRQSPFDTGEPDLLATIDEPGAAGDDDDDDDVPTVTSGVPNLGFSPLSTPAPARLHESPSSTALPLEDDAHEDTAVAMVENDILDSSGPIMAGDSTEATVPLSNAHQVSPSPLASGGELAEVLRVASQRGDRRPRTRLGWSAPPVESGEVRVPSAELPLDAAGRPLVLTGPLPRLRSAPELKRPEVTDEERRSFIESATPPPLHPPPGANEAFAASAETMGPLSGKASDMLAHLPSYQTGEGSVLGYDHALQPKQSSRFTWAHMVLGVSILVFVIAVGLLVHKLVRRSRGRASSAVVVADARTEAVDSKAAAPPAKKIRPRADAAVTEAETDKESKPDAKVREPDAKVREPDAKAREPAATPQRVPPDAPKKVVRRARMVLEVRSTPRAQVFIGGRKKGLTPFKLATRGRRKIRLALVRSGYEVYFQRLVADPDKPRLDVALKKASYGRYKGKTRGILRVICRYRDNRRIFLDGRDTGYSCPKVGYFLKPGQYTVGLFSLKWGTLKERKVRITRRQRNIVRLYKLRKYRRRRRR